mmetsp:Transcript_839/g.2966  ORF Transcript_839/g.2966 Transcript_839/m.2966 type:complete len:230 (+) Transcript_839:1493-2182(+)
MRVGVLGLEPRVRDAHDGELEARGSRLDLGEREEGLIGERLARLEAAVLPRQPDDPLCVEERDRSRRNHAFELATAAFFPARDGCRVHLHVECAGYVGGRRGGRGCTAPIGAIELHRHPVARRDQNGPVRGLSFSGALLRGGHRIRVDLLGALELDILCGDGVLLLVGIGRHLILIGLGPASCALAQVVDVDGAGLRLLFLRLALPGLALLLLGQRRLRVAAAASERTL